MMFGCLIYLEASTVIRPTPYRHTQAPQVSEAAGEIEINPVERRPSTYGQAGDVPFPRSRTDRFKVNPDSTRFRKKSVPEMRVAVKWRGAICIAAQRLT